MNQTDEQCRDYEKVYDVLQVCGQAHSPKKFVTEVVSQLGKLCPFDEALAYFFDGNGKIYNQYLVNIDESWSTMYLEYYANVDSRQCNCLKPTREVPGMSVTNVRDWSHEPTREFITGYIRPRQLKYSLGFSLFDLNGQKRAIVALDRTRDSMFTENELSRLALAIPMLNNLHKNFYYQQNNQNALNQIPWESTKLTPREIEVANLLCQGVTPANIGRTLYISLPTVYKHISHIYEKMNVSSRQELMVRLLRQSS